MAFLRRVLIFGGLALIVGGIGLFIYIIFLYPNVDPPFTVVPGSRTNADGPPPEATIDQDGYCRLAIRFAVSSEYYYSISGRSHYELRCRASVRNAASNQTVFQFDDVIGDKSISVVRDPAQLTDTPDDGKVEHRLSAFPVRAGDRLVATAEVFHDRPESDDAVGKSNVGSAADVEWFLIEGDHDPEARLNFRADGPMYGIQAAGIGIVLFFLGIWTGRFVRTQSA